MKSDVTVDRLVSVTCRRPAMASWFDFRLVGSDPEHLLSVGEAMLDEVQRVERLLSRFDPSGSLARVNREAGKAPVLIERELHSILTDCLRWHRSTLGAFNPCRPREGLDHLPIAGFDDVLTLAEDSPRVLWLDPRFEIDLGGFGKGYALDRSARLLGPFGVDSALLEGGTSSVLARGLSEAQTPWNVAIRDPLDSLVPVDHVLLQGGLSSSATFAPGTPVSDIIDPTTGCPISVASACSVVSTSASEAEVFSTALLALGAERARALVGSPAFPEHLRVLWIDCEHGPSRSTWITRQEFS
ncbi:MAG TPA: FAD:protein FMN transferase [Isosphaeraceae bacterium]|nr:FAD:protein FMN transferase [Isosphaeraceae bacterium]